MNKVIYIKKFEVEDIVLKRLLDLLNVGGIYTKKLSGRDSTFQLLELPGVTFFSTDTNHFETVKRYRKRKIKRIIDVQDR